MEKKDNNTTSLVDDYYAKIERLAHRIIMKSGYNSLPGVEPFYSAPNATDDGVDFIFQAKASSSLYYPNCYLLDRTVAKLSEKARRNNASLVLMVFALLPGGWKEKIKKQYSIFILDIANLLYIVNGTELQNELVSLLPFTVDQIEPEEPELELGWLCHKDEASDLLRQLDNCISGKSGASNFEDICSDLLNYLFADDLSLWQRQASSNQQLYRFDLLCRIKDGISKSFWHILETYFHSKYVVFEFKNYSEKVTQKEIYTTERYLYSKALRNVAIIVAKNGFDENSIWAAKGSLREDGKLILLITVSDLKEMVKIKNKHEDPSSSLLEKLDSLLVELEK